MCLCLINQSKMPRFFLGTMMANAKPSSFVHLSTNFTDLFNKGQAGLFHVAYVTKNVFGIKATHLLFAAGILFLQSSNSFTCTRRPYVKSNSCLSTCSPCRRKQFCNCAMRIPCLLRVRSLLGKTPVSLSSCCHQTRGGNERHPPFFPLSNVDSV